MGALGRFTEDWVIMLGRDDIVSLSLFLTWLV